MATPRPAEHKDIEQRFRDIEQKLQSLAGQVAKRPQFTIESGDLTIDGGDVVMLDTDGSVMFRLGAQEFGDRGLSLFRENGSAVLELKRDGVSPLLQQAWRLKDGAGNVLVGEWAFGTGLTRPRIPMPVFPVAAPAGWGLNGPEVSTTSGTFTSLFRVDTRRQNPLYQPVLSIYCSDTSTAAEVQVIDVATSDPLDNFFGGGDWVGVHAAGSTATVEYTPALSGLPGSHDSRIQLDIQVRVTAGAGTVTLAVPSSMGG